MLNRIAEILIVSLVFAFICGCDEKIPIKEMALAKMEISRALSVMAKKYAPDEIKEAQNNLTESHEFIKEDKLDKAKTSAEKSLEKATDAYNKSIPLLAKDTLDIAKQSLAQAEEVYAEVLAENEYKQAGDSLAKANELYEQKNYYPCYEKSMETDEKAKNARNVALSKKDILKNSIAEVKATLEEADKYNAPSYAGEKVDLAEESLKIAEESLENLQLKKGFIAVEAAGLNADEAYLMAITATAKNKMEEAEKKYSEAEGSEGAELSKEELGGAKESLDQSKSLFEDSKFKESILSSDESIRLSLIVLNSFNTSAKEKIAHAESIYNQAKDSEGAAVAKDDLNKAKNALDQAIAFFKESKIKESMEQAAESERLSNIVINTKGKERKGTITGKEEDIDNYFIYKVKYVPERRDCLWRISEKYYKNGLLWKHIYTANKEKIHNPDLIWPGMMLKVPKLFKPSNQEEKKEENNTELQKEAIVPDQEKNEGAVETEPETINNESSPATE